MENMNFGEWYPKTINDIHYLLQFISCSTNKSIFLRRQLYRFGNSCFGFDNGKAYIYHLFSCTIDDKDYAYHKKLRVYKNNTGYYVVCNGIRCYCNSLVPEFVKTNNLIH